MSTPYESQVLPQIEGTTASTTKRSLQDLIQSGVKLPWRIRMRIFMQVAAILESYHQTGTVHGNLGSWNIFLDEHFNVTIDGWSSAIKLPLEGNYVIAAKPNVPLSIAEDGPNGEDGGYPITLQGQAMAPEVLEFGRYSKESDMYAFGVLVCQLIFYKADGLLTLPDGRTKASWQGEITSANDCPRQLVPLVKACVNSSIAARLSAKAVNIHLAFCYSDPRHRPYFHVTVPSIPEKQAAEEIKSVDESLGDIVLPDSAELGRGGYGMVRLGKFRDKNVAVKIPLKTGFGEGSFTYEAAMYQKVGHDENIIELVATCLTPENHFCLVMELATHKTLYDLIHNGAEPLNLEIWLPLAADVSSGLKKLHGLRITHGDIKSGNILVTSSGGQLIAKLSDLGTAAELAPDEDFASSTDGTEGWRAPEVYKGRRFLQSDIYSYGVLLCELIFRETPARAPEKLNATSPRWKASVPADCPFEIRNLVLDCQNWWPTERPDAETVHACITECIQTHGFLRPTAKAPANMAPAPHSFFRPAAEAPTGMAPVPMEKQMPKAPENSHHGFMDRIKQQFTFASKRR